MGRAKEFDTETVLRKATSVFGAYGYEGTSLSLLLSELGIARQSLYDTYGTKHDLFVSALKFYIQQKTEAGIKLLNECTSVRQGVTELFNEAVNVLTDNERRNECFIINSAVEQAPQNHEIAVFIQTTNQQMEDVFHTALLRGQRSGELRHAEEELPGLARFLNYSRLSLTFTAKSGASAEALRDFVQMTLRALD
ncbi:TetR/AcrR family transcriptional repressor of nem operon [Paenibacillus sp. DS2363]|uniref:TetR/AcrR family transcriptional regulator n=1 Tax=Paenibacillus TaxID=44249 RepID=UPI0020A05BA7|nr:TetR/AcrR family transcriptional regulator [Paenibacillus xylanexedens]MCP1426552.1 TetR/AcrR family transcriptional repressor of nem operon [Paenibacillus xylanexedens]